MAYRKKANPALIVIAVVLAIALTFLVVSLCLANAHGNTLVAEWQNWFGIVKKATDEVKTPEDAETVTSALRMLFKI